MKDFAAEAIILNSLKRRKLETSKTKSLSGSNERFI